MKLFSIIAVLGIVGALTYIVWGGLEENLVYFVTPTELIQKGEQAIGEQVRLGGVVVPGSVRKDQGVVFFQITDDVNEMTVTTHSTPPQMFQESMGVVVEGKLQGPKEFLADRVMVKHNEEYHPPKEGEMPHELYKQIVGKNHKSP